MTPSVPLLVASSVRYGYPACPDFLGPIDLAIHAGDCWAIVGPNGAGKSTLVRLLAGLRRPAAGSIELHGRRLGSLTPQERARRIAFLPQSACGALTDVQLTAHELVLMGRYPHRRIGLFESPEDWRIADEAMRITDVYGYRDRRLSTLSGGEAQRVHLAAALAQQPELLILDEPTTGLDLKHQIDLFEILRDQVSGCGPDAGLRKLSAWMVVTHDVNLAARYATHVLLLHEGRAIASGPPQAVLRPSVLENVYGVRLHSLADAEGHPWLVPFVVQASRLHGAAGTAPPP
jgi:iron complex transport system ATP-binding protein